MHLWTNHPHNLIFPYPKHKNTQPLIHSSISSHRDITDLQNTAHEATTLRPTVKYKTQLCKNFSEKGYCPYRNKCQFAHGVCQLVVDVFEDNKNFRTKNCKSFWTNHFCLYGGRCQFSHQMKICIDSLCYLRIWKMAVNCGVKGEGSRLLLLLRESKSQGFK